MLAPVHAVQEVAGERLRPEAKLTVDGNAKVASSWAGMSGWETMDMPMLRQRHSRLSDLTNMDPMASELEGKGDDLWIET